MGGVRAKIDYILKHNIFINKIFVFCVSFGFKILGLFIKVDDSVVIFSGHSRKYNDSPKILYEYMISKPEY